MGTIGMVFIESNRALSYFCTIELSRIKIKKDLIFLIHFEYFYIFEIFILIIYAFNVFHTVYKCECNLTCF